LSGRDSVLDNQNWLNVPDRRATPLQPCVAFNAAVKALSRHFIRIPQLMRLVRAARIDPTDTGALLSALELASDLANSDLESRLKPIIVKSVELRPTMSSDIAAVMPKPYHFDSLQRFALLIRYLTFRVYLSGLLQSLQSLSSASACTPLFSLLSLPTLQTSDLAAATAIAMSLDYTFSIAPSLLLVPLRILMPLQISFGAWHRLERRCMMLDPEAERAKTAKTAKSWAAGMIDSIQRRWKAVPSLYAELEANSEMFAGRPFGEWIGRRRAEQVVPS
jgi:hypothetical protein